MIWKNADALVANSEGLKKLALDFSQNLVKTYLNRKQKSTPTNNSFLPKKMSFNTDLCENSSGVSPSAPYTNRCPKKHL